MPSFFIFGRIRLRNARGVPQPDRAIRSNQKRFLSGMWSLRAAQTP
jgi:hypothetical protein